LTDVFAPSNGEVTPQRGLAGHGNCPNLHSGGSAMKLRNASFGLLLIAAGQPAFSQQPAPRTAESHKYRVIFTIAGAGGGYTAGVFAGIAAFDDAVNSDRKVWTTALIMAAGGAIGGYFLGRALDKSRSPKGGGSPAVTPWVRDEFDQSLARAKPGSMRTSPPAAEPGISTEPLPDLPIGLDLLPRSNRIFQSGTR
jgi:hypothetical protein